MKLARVTVLFFGFLLGFTPLIYLLTAAVFLEVSRLVWRVF